MAARAARGARGSGVGEPKRKGSGEAKSPGFNRANERWQQKKKTAMIGARRAEELTYEKGFARIRELTGIDDLGELVAKFLDLEASAFHDWRVSRQHAAEIDEAEAAVAALREEAAQAAAEAQEGRRAMQVRVDASTRAPPPSRLARARHEKAAAAARDVTRFVGETLGGWACAAPTVALLGAIGLRAHQLELPNVQLNDGDNDDDDDAPIVAAPPPAAATDDDDDDDDDEDEDDPPEARRGRRHLPDRRGGGGGGGSVDAGDDAAGGEGEEGEAGEEDAEEIARRGGDAPAARAAALRVLSGDCDRHRRSRGRRGCRRGRRGRGGGGGEAEAAAAVEAEAEAEAAEAAAAEAAAEEEAAAAAEAEAAAAAAAAVAAAPTAAPEPAYADRAATAGPYAWEALSGVELQKVLGGVEELGGELLRLYADAHTSGCCRPTRSASSAPRRSASSSCGHWRRGCAGGGGLSRRRSPPAPMRPATATSRRRPRRRRRAPRPPRSCSTPTRAR